MVIHNEYTIRNRHIPVGTGEKGGGGDIEIRYGNFSNPTT